MDAGGAKHFLDSTFRFLRFHLISRPPGIEGIDGIDGYVTHCGSTAPYPATQPTLSNRTPISYMGYILKP